MEDWFWCNAKDNIIVTLVEYIVYLHILIDGEVA